MKSKRTFLKQDYRDLLKMKHYNVIVMFFVSVVAFFSNLWKYTLPIIVSVLAAMLFDLFTYVSGTKDLPQFLSAGLYLILVVFVAVSLLLCFNVIVITSVKILEKERVRLLRVWSEAINNFWKTAAISIMLGGAYIVVLQFLAVTYFVLGFFGLNSVAALVLLAIGTIVATIIIAKIHPIFPEALVRQQSLGTSLNEALSLSNVKAVAYRKFIDPLWILILLFVGEKLLRLVFIDLGQNVFGFGKRLEFEQLDLEAIQYGFVIYYSLIAFVVIWAIIALSSFYVNYRNLQKSNN